MRMLLSVLLALPSHSKTLLVIDDIDNLLAPARKDFLHLLVEMFDRLQGRGREIRILITSRPYQDIGDILKDLPVIRQATEYKGD